MARSLAELCSCPSVLWKVELVSNETGYLVEEISKQSVEEATYFILNADSKMEEDSLNDLQVELLTNKDAELKDLENSYYYLTLYILLIYYVLACSSHKNVSFMGAGIYSFTAVSLVPKTMSGTK